MKASEMRPILKRMWAMSLPVLSRNRSLTTGSSIALLGGVLFALLEPWPLKFVIDRLFGLQQNVTTNEPGWIAGLDGHTLLMVAGLIYVGICILQAVSNYWSKVGFTLLSLKVLAKLRASVYKHLLGLSIRYHDKAKDGDLIVRLTGDMNRVRDSMITAALPLVSKLLILVGMLGVMFWLQWQLTLVGLIVVPLFLYSAIKISRSINQIARKRRKSHGAMAGSAAEALGAIRTVKSFHLEQVFAKTFSGQNASEMKAGGKAVRLRGKLEGRVAVFSGIAVALVLFMGAGFVMEGSLTPGEFVVFMTYLKRSLRPMQTFAKYSGRMAKATAAAERVLEVLDEKAEIQEDRKAIVFEGVKSGIEFRDVKFQYHSKSKVFQALDIRIEAGTHVAIVGPSGIGKTTLASLLMRFYDPDEGSITIDGTELKEFQVGTLRKQIGMVSQENLLFAGSIRENLLFANPEACDKEIESAAKLAQAHQFISEMEDGYDTMVGQRGATLSHGQKQRIAIARAALADTPVLIFDEPTTGLDNQNARDVMRSLQKLSKGRTVLTATHDLSHAAMADRILYLGEGHVLEEGNHEALMSLDGRYAKLYALQRSANRKQRKLDDAVTG